MINRISRPINYLLCDSCDHNVGRLGEKNIVSATAGDHPRVIPARLVSKFFRGSNTISRSVRTTASFIFCFDSWGLSAAWNLYYLWFLKHAAS
jgi:hypothetical protein